MKEPSPSLQEWKALCDAAVRFKEVESWNWMYDSDVFGVQNPANKEIGYCCIMGKLGQMFALAVYLGTEGLEGYLKIQSGKVSPEHIDATGGIDVLMLQKCLMASFEDREMLQRPDLQVIKKLGLRFRGRNAWPFFRSYQPGYHPWYVTKDEARYLTLALQQATEVALRFKEDPELLVPPERNCYFVRVPEKEGERWKWKDAWLEPAPMEREERGVEPIVDEVRLQRIRNTVGGQRGVWEGDFFYAPSPVQEKGARPYYPYVIFWVERRSGAILKADLIEPSEYTLEFPERFLSLVEEVKFLPVEVRVRKEEAFDLLEPIASRLKIKLKRDRRLKELERAQASMFEFFRGPLFS